MLYGIGNIHLVARDAGFSKRLVEHSTRRSDERMSLQVFHVAGLLADENDIRAFRAFAENRLGRVFVEIASFASSRRRAQAFKIPPLGKKFRCGGLPLFLHNLKLPPPAMRA